VITSICAFLVLVGTVIELYRLFTRKIENLIKLRRNQTHSNEHKNKLEFSNDNQNNSNIPGVAVKGKKDTVNKYI
jgi:hypothetical protein